MRERQPFSQVAQYCSLLWLRSEPCICALDVGSKKECIVAIEFLLQPVGEERGGCVFVRKYLDWICRANTLFAFVQALDQRHLTVLDEQIHLFVVSETKEH